MTSPSIWETMALPIRHVPGIIWDGVTEYSADLGLPPTPRITVLAVIVW